MEAPTQPLPAPASAAAAGAAAADSPYEINVDRFWKRLGVLHGHWQRNVSNQQRVPNPYPGWDGCDSVLILCGKSDDAGYKRNNSIHIWLFGYELLSTIIVITRTDIYICAGSKTSQTLQQLKSNGGGQSAAKQPLSIHLITKNKSDGYANNFEFLRATLSAAGNKVGLIREEMKGFADKFQGLVCEHFAVVSFSEGLSEVMMLKDKYETSTMRKVAELTSQALKFFQKTMERLINEEQTKRHSELSELLLSILEEPKMVKSQLRRDNLDVCYDPIIQSGGRYRLRPSAESDDEPLHYDYGVVVAMMGFRLRDYCSNIARTFLIDPSAEQKEVYNVLVTVFKKGLLMLRDGVPLGRVYDKCTATIRKSKRPALEQHFLKSVGWGIGLEFRDKNYIIRSSNGKVCRQGMVFNFQVGFEGLVDPKKEARGLQRAKDYAIILADTVLVTDGQPVFLTKAQRKLLEYELHGDIDRDTAAAKKKEKGKSPKPRVKPKAKRSRSRSPNKASSGGSQAMAVDGGASDDAYLPSLDQPNRRVTRQSNRKSAQEQKEVMRARRERAKKQSKPRKDRKKRLEALLEETGGALGGAQTGDQWRDPTVYGDANPLPGHLRQSKVAVDLANECLICPVMDHMVPFHISTIKNFSISSTLDGTYLRINFVCPVAGKGAKQPQLFLQHPDCHFIKELTYRNDGGGENLSYCHQQLKELQKQMKAKKKHKMLNKTMVKQDRLQRAPSNKVLFLKELSLRPNMGGRKRGGGRLECHQNGFKYVDHKKNELYILFNNVKNAFFQKSKNTPSVLIHFRLHNAIMIGKKPSEHVQVYRDVIERFEELGRRRRFDYDGMRAEQEEQQRIRRTNSRFKDFCERVTRMAEDNGFSLLFEKPAFDLVLTGVPNKSCTNMYPTESCLVALEDAPAFVIDTGEVEIAHFERVNFSLRNFDVVFVFKDLSREPHRVTTVPREHLDTLQDFLNWKGVLYSTGKINLDWKNLMAKVRSNLAGFVESGGWDFLLEQDEDRVPSDDGRRDPNRPPSEDEYVPSDEEDYGSDDYSDDEDDDDYESDEMYSDEEDGGFDDEEEEEGLDWDELDRRAALEDKKTSRRENEESRRTRMEVRNRAYRANNRVSPGGMHKRRRY